MKRIGHLYHSIIAPENLWQGYLEARRGKRATGGCLAFEKSIGARLAALHTALVRGDYQPAPLRVFEVREPKPRLIHAPSFADRVVQHAAYRLVRPVFDATFVRESFACRPGYGTHAAADHVQAALRAAPPDSYLVQLDVRRFFYSIDREILRALVERRLKEARTVALMMRLVTYGEPLGIPIGCLLSQLCALIYLNPLDHFIKRELRVRHYARYVDDMVLIGLTRTQAHEARAEVEQFLQQRLHLRLSQARVAPVRCGINFCGYRTWRSRRFVRRRALYNARRAARRDDREAVVSLLGHARRSHSLQPLLTYTRDHNHDLYHALPATLRCLHRASRHGG